MEWHFNVRNALMGKFTGSTHPMIDTCLEAPKRPLSGLSLKALPDCPCFQVGFSHKLLNSGCAFKVDCPKRNPFFYKDGDGTIHWECSACSNQHNQISLQTNQNKCLLNSQHRADPHHTFKTHPVHILTILGAMNSQQP